MIFDVSVSIGIVFQCMVSLLKNSAKVLTCLLGVRIRTLNDQHKTRQDKRHKMWQLARDKPPMRGNLLIRVQFFFNLQ